jgi:hypothetical protein
VISRIFAAPESTSQPRTKGGRTCAAGGPSATSRKT